MTSRALLRFMTDSTTAADNPSSGTIVAGYVDGLYANVPALHKRYPHGTVVTITVNGRDDADVVDQENGDASPVTAAVWVRSQRKDGKHPTVYCSVAELRAVIAAMHAIGLCPDDASFWTAHYGTGAHMCTAARCWAQYGELAFTPRIVATQYDDKGPKGQHYDRSEVAAYWPGIDPDPIPILKPTRSPLSPRMRILAPRATRLCRHIANAHLAHRTVPPTPAAAKALTALDDAAYLLRKQIARAKSL